MTKFKSQRFSLSSKSTEEKKNCSNLHYQQQPHVPFPPFPFPVPKTSKNKDNATKTSKKKKNIKRMWRLIILKLFNLWTTNFKMFIITTKSLQQTIITNQLLQNPFNRKLITRESQINYPKSYQGKN